MSYHTEPAEGESAAAVVRIGTQRIVLEPATGMTGMQARERERTFRSAVAQALQVAGYPEHADPQAIDRLRVVAILWYLMLLVTMVYGPLAAALAEMFPTRIRYTAMSLPYHIGNGWFGGMLPPMAFAIVAQTGNMYSGLWYPVLIAGVGAFIGALWLRETRGVDMYAED